MHTSSSLFAVIAAAVLIPAAVGETINDDLTVTGTTDVQGNVLSLGTEGTTSGVNLIYTPGAPAFLDFDATNPIAWRWSTAGNPQMDLGTSNVFQLYAPGSVTPSVQLVPGGTTVVSEAFRIQTNLSQWEPSWQHGWRQFNWGGMSDLNWKKVARFRLSGDPYSGIAFEGRIYDYRNNYGGNHGIYVPFSGYARRHTASIRQGRAEYQYVRIIKLAARDYELQVRQPVIYRWMQVEWRITGDHEGNEYFEYYDNFISDGTTPTSDVFDPTYDVLSSAGTLWAESIGVGKINPSEALDVVGNAKISGSLTVAGPITFNNGQTLSLPSNGRIAVNTADSTGLGSIHVQASGTIGAGDFSSASFTTSSGSQTLAIGPDQITTTGSPLHFANLTHGFIFNATGDVSSSDFVIAPNGNVGIGIASPRVALDVVGSGMVSSNLAVGTSVNDVGAGNPNQAISGRLKIRADGEDATALFIKGNSAEYAGLKIKLGPANISGAADYYDFTIRPSVINGVSQIADVTAIRINNTRYPPSIGSRTHPDVHLVQDGGKVAVGKDNPEATLDVNGSAQFAGDISVKNNAVIRISPAGDLGMGLFVAGVDPSN